MKITKEQLLNTVLSLKGDLPFMASVIRGCFEDLPEPVKTNLLNELIINHSNLDEYFEVYDTLEDDMYIFLTIQDVYMFLKPRYPSLKKGMVHHGVRVGHYKHYKLARIKVQHAK